MLLGICGTRSALSRVIQRLAARIAEETIGVPYPLVIASKEQLSETWKSIPLEKRQSILLYSEFPLASFRQLLVDSNISVIICMDDFEEIFAWQKSKEAEDFMLALRLATQCAVMTSQLIPATRHLLITPDKYETPVLDVAREILKFFSIRCDEAQWEKLRKILGGEKGDGATLRDFAVSQISDAPSTAEVFKALSPEDRHAAVEVARGYAPLSNGLPIETVSWTRRCFIDGDVTDRPVMGSKLLVGPARCLFFGPYIHLPPGQWNCELEIEVNDCPADTLAMADVYDDDIIAAVSMRLPRRGVYVIDMPFENRRVDAALQFRLSLLKGSIEGELLLHRARLKRVDPQDNNNLRLTNEAQ